MQNPMLARFRLAFAALTSVSAVALAGGGCGDDSQSTGGTGAGGVGGSAPTCSLDAQLGETLDLPKDTWTWVDFPDSLCMNGTPTGIAVNPSSTSNKLVIFLEGGNACFNVVSCQITVNTDGFGAAQWEDDDAGARTQQYFDRTDPNNPFKDYSYAYVPYCTGDVHSGDASNVAIGSKTWQFHGRKNIEAYLKRLVPTFRGADQIVLTGVSAGGFGAAVSYDTVASAFCNNDVVLIDDSGPPMGSQFLAPCLQKHMMETWGFDRTLPADCADCRPADGAFAEPYVRYIVGKYPESTLGLISTESDVTISQFWGFGENNCASLMGAPDPYPAGKYKQGLEDLRDRIIGGQGNFKLFMIPGSEHVLLDNDPTTVTVGGANLKDWLTKALSGDPTWSNVP